METKVPSDVVESTPAKTTEQEIVQNRRKSSTINPNIPPSDTLIDENEIYEYYQRLIPALVSSLPLLLHKMKEDSGSFVYNSIMKMVHLLIPFTREDFEWHAPHVPHVASEAYGNVTQFLLSHFDLDEDGHISPSELLHVNFEHFPNKPHFQVPTKYTGPLISRLTSWPLVDWNLASLLWRSCGGLLIIFISASIIPGRLHGLSGRLLRWPVLALTYLTIASELVVYIMVRLFIRLLESTFTTKKHRSLRKALENAESYDEWLNFAKKLDFSQGRDEWQNRIDDDTSHVYNWVFINELIADMKKARKNNDIMLALVVLQQCTRKNVGGIMNEDLFSYTNSGEPKIIVKEFLEEVVETLGWITKISKTELETSATAESNIDGMVIENKMRDNRQHNNTNIIQAVIENPHLQHVVRPLRWAIHFAATGRTGGGSKNDYDDKEVDGDVAKPHIPNNRLHHTLNKQQRKSVKTFLKRARAAYGRTALCLSGGAMMGCYHFGHVRALLDEGVLPHIISGTSSGSVVAALLCTRTDEEIRRDMRSEILVNKLTCFTKTWLDRFKNVYENGCLFDQQDWIDLIKWFTCGDMTFEEAHEKTGRILCITLSSTTKKAPPVLVNYITAPNVTIASAIIASAAVPGFIKPVILRKKGPDGVVREQAANKDEAYWDGSIDQDIPISGLAEMFNCQFFLTAQCNPHVVPFFHSSKGCVGQPSRWIRGKHENAWRGGFLLAATQLYLKNDMISKHHFLHDMEAAVGFTSTMMTQIFHGSTTIVPNVSISDYFCLFSNPSLPFLQKCSKAGQVAAFKHCAMMKLHYSVSNALDKCLAMIESDDASTSKPSRKISKLAKVHYYQELSKLEVNNEELRKEGYALGASPFPKEVNHRDINVPTGYNESELSTHSSATESTSYDDDLGRRL